MNRVHKSRTRKRLEPKNTITFTIHIYYKCASDFYLVALSQKILLTRLVRASLNHSGNKFFSSPSKLRLPVVRNVVFIVPCQFFLCVTACLKFTALFALNGISELGRNKLNEQTCLEVRATF